MKPESIEVKPVLPDDEAEILAARNAFARRGAEIAARRRAEMEAAAMKAGQDGGDRTCSGPDDDVVPDEPPAWPEPQPLTVKVEPEVYPVDALPPRIRVAIEEVQRYVQAPLPMVASSALAALSVAIQAYADVQRDSRLSGPSSLFLVVIADSGERKTTCDSFFMCAIRDYEKAQVEAAQPDLARHRAEFQAWDAKVSGLKDRIRQDTKAGKPTAQREADLSALEAEKPEPLRVPRLLYSDVTPEALAWSLARGWPAGGVVSAEAGTVFGSHGMGADSVMRIHGRASYAGERGTARRHERRGIDACDAGQHARHDLQPPGAQGRLQRIPEPVSGASGVGAQGPGAMPHDARSARGDKEPAPGRVRQTGEYRERAATGEQRACAA